MSKTLTTTTQNVTVIMFCAACRKKGEFKAESYTDCYIKASVAGWTQDQRGNNYCGDCEG